MNTFNLTQRIDYRILNLTQDAHSWGEKEVIKQLSYWLSQVRIGWVVDGVKWVKIKYEELASQLKVSVRSVKRYVALLVEKGILKKKKLSKNKSDQTNSYAIVHDVLFGSLLCENDLKNDQNTEPDSLKDDIKNDASNDLFSAIPECQNGTIRECQNGTMVIHTLQDINYNNRDDEKKMNLEEERDVSLDRKPVQIDPVDLKVVEEMKAIWNYTFSDTKVKKILRTDFISDKMMRAYKNSFDSDMSKFEHYCKLIRSSKYLTGDKFDLSFSWALNDTAVNRIYHDRDLGVSKDMLRVPSKKDLYEQSIDRIAQVKDLEGERCHKLRKKLLEVFKETCYVAWFIQTSFSCKDGIKIDIAAPNRFVKDNVVRMVDSVIEKV